MEPNKKAKFTVNVERRRWDLQDYERRAQQAARANAVTANTALIPTAPLRHRDAPLPLTATLGKSILISPTTPLSSRGGYYCDVCVCLLKDSATYLDHINGRRHQRLQGMTMKVDKVGVDEVKERLKGWTERKEEENRERRGKGKRKKGQEEDNSQREDKDAEEKRQGRSGEAEEAKNEAKTSATEATATSLDRTEDEEEEAMMAAMGFKFKAFAAGKKT